MIFDLWLNHEHMLEIKTNWNLHILHFDYISAALIFLNATVFILWYAGGGHQVDTNIVYI